jgi:DNA-binding CsgD family transcriptional regulator/tetratricopeptide (TPR) repeat protein
VLLGRSAERAAIDRVVDAARAGRADALVLRGEAGIGKTALLDDAVAHASDLTVIRVVGVESEMGMGFAALHRLMLSFLSARDRLPGPQREALEAAFGLRSDGQGDVFLVGLAVLTLLGDVARERPLLCIVDDAQWLDQESINVLAFVARRVYADQIALLFAIREPSESPVRVDGLPDLHLRGLDDRDALELLGSVAGEALGPLLANRIVSETHGNPLALVELGGELTADHLAGAPITEPLPVSDLVEARFLRQVRALPRDTQLLLLVAAADGVGAPATVLRAGATLDISADALTPAEAAGLVVATPLVEFRHPLMRTAIYHGATLADLRRVHGALAAVLDGEGDADRRAWHAAEAVLGPDEAVALQLERSAERARARSGFTAESAYLQRAAELTPDPRDRVRRLLDAARAAQIAGAWTQARTLLTRAQPLLEDPRQSADALRLRASLLTDLGRPAGAVAMMLEAAETLQRIDVAAARDVMLEALHTSQLTDPIGGSVTARDLARAIQGGPRPDTGGRDLTELVLEGFAARVIGDAAEATPKLQAVANALASGQEPDARELWPWFGFVAALEVWDDTAAYAILEQTARLQRAEGALQPLRMTLLALAARLIASGRLPEAESCYDEAIELTFAVGHDPELFNHLNGELLAWQGRDEEARDTVGTAIAVTVAAGFNVHEHYAMQALTALELSAGNYDAVRVAVKPSYDHDMMIFGNWALPQLIEAAVRLGDDELAEAALERLAERATVAANPWGLGLLARSRALLVGDEDAESFFQEAIALLERTSMRPDLARAHLLYGEWLRRQKRKADAREQLHLAHDLFSGMGAAAFAERARLELAATGEHAPASATQRGFDLTPQEARIARLAAQRATSREIAAELYISPNTVDYHLRKVFQKVGVNSRRALRAALPDLT